MLLLLLLTAAAGAGRRAAGAAPPHFAIGRCLRGISPDFPMLASNTFIVALQSGDAAAQELGCIAPALPATAFPTKTDDHSDGAVGRLAHYKTFGGDTVSGESGERETGGPGAAARAVVSLQKQLRACAKKLPAGSDLLERVTLELSVAFLNYSTWDTAHAESLAGFWAAWHGRGTHPSASDKEAARRLPGIELRQTADALRRAIATCQSQASKRPTIDSACAQQLAVDHAAGFFARARSVNDGQQRFSFPCGYNFEPTPTASDCQVRGINIADISIGIHMLEAATLSVPNKTVQAVLGKLDALHTAGVRASIFLSQSAMPAWAEAKYAGINPVHQEGHFFGYDIDHPATRVLWAALFDSLLPRIGAHPAIYGYLLANEPEFPTFGGQYAYAKLHAWLINKYNVTSRLNKAWGTDWKSFNAVANLTFAPSQWKTWRPDSVSVAQWADMDGFNKWRVTDFFTFLHDAIGVSAHRAASGPHLQQSNANVNIVSDCQIKVSNAGHPWGSLPASGIDRLALMDLTEINGCDTRMWASSDSHLPFRQHLTDTYALDWVGLSAAYDFQRSIAPQKPLLDSEWHSLSTVHFRAETAPVSHRYLGTALWLARLHGQAGLEMWYWGREPNGAANSGGAPSALDRTQGTWFPYSLSAESAQFDSFLRAHAASNSIADTIVAAANTPREVWVLHSPLSALMDQEASGWELATYSATAGLGVSIGWIPTRSLQALASGEALNISGGGHTCRSILVPCTSHIDDAGFTALRKISEKAALLLVGNSSCTHTALLRDSLGQPRDAAAMAWVRSLRSVDIGNVVDDRALAAMDAAVSTALSSPPLGGRSIRCVGPGNSRVGIFCRAVALEGTPGRYALFVINMLNVTTRIALVCPQQTGSHLYLDHVAATSLVFGSPVDLGSEDVPALSLEPLELAALNVTLSSTASAINNVSGTR